MPLCFSLHTHKCSLSLSLSGEKHYKREKLLVSNSQWRRWPQLWGGKEPENNSKWSQGRINGPVLAQSSEGLLNLTDMYINTQHFYWIRGVKKREGEIWIFILIYISRHFQSYGRLVLVLTNFHPHYRNDSFHSWALAEVWPGAQEVRRGGSRRLFPAVHKHSLTEENIQWNLCENF